MISFIFKRLNCYLCLVHLCDQNSFGGSKMVLVWPNWFGLDHNDLVTTKMNWSSPNCDFQPRGITIWTWPIHFGRNHFILVETGQVQINLVRPKPFWTGQNCFGHIEGRTRHQCSVHKTRKWTSSRIGNFGENMDLSRIYIQSCAY